jgi:hypothetical protein
MCRSLSQVMPNLLRSGRIATQKQVVVGLLHPHAFAAHRVVNLQQQPMQQLLRRNRGPLRLGVQLAEARLQLPKRYVGHDKHRTKRMVLRNTLLRAYAIEHIQLLLVVSTHSYFLPA